MIGESDLSPPGPPLRAPPLCRAVDDHRLVPSGRSYRPELSALGRARAPARAGKTARAYFSPPPRARAHADGAPPFRSLTHRPPPPPRHPPTGNGASLKASPKKGGGGGHNWGSWKDDL
jgi:hypothetical protein